MARSLSLSDVLESCHTRDATFMAVWNWSRHCIKSPIGLLILLGLLTALLTASQPQSGAINSREARAILMRHDSNSFFYTRRQVAARAADRRLTAERLYYWPLSGKLGVYPELL